MGYMCKVRNQARTMMKTTRNIIKTNKIFSMSHLLEDTLCKCFNKAPCAPSTLARVSSMLSSILKIMKANMTQWERKAFKPEISFASSSIQLKFYLIANSPCCDTITATCENMPLSSAMVDSTAWRALNDLLRSCTGANSCCSCMLDKEPPTPIRRLQHLIEWIWNPYPFTLLILH